jgi:hypothetical protein
MKKILIALMLMFSVPAFAGKTVNKEMLEQVWNVSGSSFKPVVVDATYVVKRKTSTIIVVRFYDANKTDADPEYTDMQAVFVKTKTQTKLVAITLSPVDVTPYIDLLVE